MQGIHESYTLGRVERKKTTSNKSIEIMILYSGHWSIYVFLEKHLDCSLSHCLCVNRISVMNYLFRNPFLDILYSIYIFKIFLLKKRERESLCLFMLFIPWHACGGHRKKMGHSFLISLCRLWKLKSGCWAVCQASYLLSSLIYSSYFYYFILILLSNVLYLPTALLKLFILVFL